MDQALGQAILDRSAMGVFSFVPAPIPPGDHERSRTVEKSGIITREPDPQFTLLSKLAAKLFAVRWAGLCIIVDDFQHVVASSDGMIGTYRRATSLSSYVIAFPDEPFCLLDAADDDRFSGNPFVNDGLVRFFAAAPVWWNGHVLGALTVADRRPKREVSSTQLRELQKLADAVDGWTPSRSLIPRGL